MSYQPYEGFNYALEGPVQGNDYGSSTAYQFVNSAESQAACKFLLDLRISNKFERNSKLNEK